LNVCIYRLPRGESVVTPRSHCPACGKLIAGYDNIPLLSYLILGGRCRHCRTRFSPRYFFIELATGLLFVACVMVYGPTLEFARQATFGSLLLVLFFTDWQHRILPDRINFPGMAIGLLFSVIVPVGDGTGLWLARLIGMPALPTPVVSLLDALLGAAVGSGFLYSIGEIWKRLRSVEAMGLGDVKMMAMAGCFLGPKLTLLTMFVASVLGSILGVVASAFLVGRPSYYGRFRRRFPNVAPARLYCTLVARQQIPFGCFLAVAAFAASLWGWPLLDWYRGFFP
jgi:leader peptidase (prepilin peptidase)/N-methyltransferase